MAIVKGVNGYEKTSSMLKICVTDMTKWGYTHSLHVSVFFAQHPCSPPWPNGKMGLNLLVVMQFKMVN